MWLPRHTVNDHGNTERTPKPNPAELMATCDYCQNPAGDGIARDVPATMVRWDAMADAPTAVCDACGALDNYVFEECLSDAALSLIDAREAELGL
ncbi:MAG: hypothetical protein ACRD2H_07325 [Terriglobales bacterium]